MARKRRLTNASIHWRGNTKVVSARLAAPVLEEIDTYIGRPGLPDRGAIIQDAVALWALLEEDEDAGT